MGVWVMRDAIRKMLGAGLVAFTGTLAFSLALRLFSDEDRDEEQDTGGMPWYDEGSPARL